jgi:prepilin-type N-terminal cleavage/methylation domain-containing protein
VDALTAIPRSPRAPVCVARRLRPWKAQFRAASCELTSASSVEPREKRERGPEHRRPHSSNRQLAIGNRQFARLPNRRSPIANRKSQIANTSPSAFTLIELLVTLGIIVLILAIAIPAVNLLTGERSIEGAQNQIAAELSLARSRAQSLQREGGLLFYLDPASDRVGMRHVTASPRELNSTIVRGLELMPETDPVLLPGGVTMQFLFVGDQPGGLQSEHRYTGFNRLDEDNAGARFGGVVLFDSQGRVLVTPTWPLVGTAAAELLGTDISSLAEYPGPVRSLVGFVLVDRANFTGQFDVGEDLSKYEQGEQDEEEWLDENARLLLLNRYNGTFVQ